MVSHIPHHERENSDGVTQKIGVLSHPKVLMGLPGCEAWPPFLCGQHVDTPGVDVLGHLENLIEFVIQRRLTSRSRQRVNM